jgi:pSer/pThr/pTyr-binding forkhead associated (FHA) protein
MTRVYIIQEKGILEREIYALEKRLTIGRRPENNICLSDLSVSRQHAVIYVEGDRVFVEDLGSHNGTFVNAKRAQKIKLKNGDTLEVGKAKFRFVQEDIPLEQAGLSETQEALTSDVSNASRSRGRSRQFRMIRGAIAKVPLFSVLDEEGLEHATKTARLMVFEQGSCIIQQGDFGKSLYLVLEGKVGIFTQDYKGREIFLEDKSENQMVGEISYLTGVPCTTTVKAAEQTLLCELGHEAIREILDRYPQVKDSLQQYHQRRIRGVRARQRAEGLRERRRHPRFNEQLTVSFTITPGSRISETLRGRVFHSISTEVSNSGIRLHVTDQTVSKLAIGSQLKLRISLPQPWGVFQCLGVLKHIERGKEGQEAYYLGVEFVEIPQAYRRRLGQYRFR